MEFCDYELNFSQQRMQRYLIAAGHDHDRAIALYQLNIDISKSFYPLIGALEVALRNRLYAVLTDHFKDPNWIINQKSGFMADSSLARNSRQRQARHFDGFLLREVEKAEHKIRRQNSRLTSASILAEQSLGFWTEFFEERYYRLLRGKPIQAFGKLPPNHGRREICQMLHVMRKLRNRISHNEPIIFTGMQFDLAPVNKVRVILLDLSEWLNPQLHGWIKSLDDRDLISRLQQAA